MDEFKHVFWQASLAFAALQELIIASAVITWPGNLCKYREQLAKIGMIYVAQHGCPACGVILQISLECHATPC